MESEFSDEFSFVRASSGSTMRKISNGSESTAMSKEPDDSRKIKSKEVLMLDRIAQITALIDARNEVQNKIEAIFSEDQKAFDSAIRNMSKIDLPKLIVILADALQTNILGIDNNASENSSHIHELMFALDKFRDSSISNGEHSSFKVKDGDQDSVQPLEKTKAG